MSDTIFNQDDNRDLGPSGTSSGGCADGDYVENHELNVNVGIICKEHGISEENFFSRAYSSLCRMQQAKDARYGNSALKPLKIFSKHHAYGTRIDEKLARVKYSAELRKNDVADIIGGLMLICQDNGWDHFEDLID